MAKTEWYRQCTYTTPGENGGVTQETAWIPEELSVVGKTIYFGKKTDTPEKLWTVISVGGRLSGEYLKEHARNYLTQRKASDI